MSNRNEAFRFGSVAIRRGENFSGRLNTVLRNNWKVTKITTQGGESVNLNTTGLLKIARAMKTDLEDEGFNTMANQLFPGIPSNPPREDSPTLPKNPKPAVQPPSRELTLPTNPTVLERYQEHLIHRAVQLRSLLKKFGGQEIAPTKDGVPIPLDKLRDMALTAFQDMQAAGLKKEAKTIFEAKPAPDSQ